MRPTDVWRHERNDEDESDENRANDGDGAVDFELKDSLAMLRSLNHTLNHPDMTPELTEGLSTPSVELGYRVETGVRVR